MTGADPDRSMGVYGITTAAGLVGTGVQNLRLYERRGLIEPDRTSGGTRRYSIDDLDRLRRISALLGEGLNMAGIAMVLDLEASNQRLEAELARREPTPPHSHRDQPPGSEPRRR